MNKVPHPNAWIKTKLAEHGLTQKELAERLDISEHSLYRKLKCEVGFTWDEIVDICSILDINNPLYCFASKNQTGR